MERPANSPDRYFILTPGRTGSTLLAAILADAGANFGLPAVEDWTRDSGEFELRLATRATRYTVEMRRFGYRPPAPPLRYLYLWHRRRARRLLRKALRQAEFVKVAHGHTLLGPALQLGFAPKVILSVRDFPSCALSTGRKDRAAKLFGDIRAEYVDTLASGLLAIQVFGGCVVDYGELCDPGQTAWAERLETATGIAASSLLAARGERLKPVRDGESCAVRCPEAEAMYRTALSLTSGT